MTERLLQFIWQMQYFNKNDLRTSENETLQIISSGRYNTDQGPDFQEASIKINSTTWVGNIELHVKASDWDLHKHGEDKNYRNIILHVVWENNNLKEGSLVEAVPVLVLADRVSKLLLERYEGIMEARCTIPCSGSLATVPDLVWAGWKARLVAERLTRKTKTVEKHLEETKGHWEEVFWWVLARNFGVSVNQDAFEAIARSVRVKTLAKHKQQIHQLEAFLMGQAGLLDFEFQEDYPKMLKKEFRFYQRKYHFTPVHEPVHFLRMRPGNFPTIRLAQLAKLIQQSSSLFAKIKSTSSVKQLREMLMVTANDYWHYHYRFDEISAFRKKVLGKQMTDNIIINTIVPVVFAYGEINQELRYKDKALRWLEAVAAEQNHITREWTKLGAVNQTAYDSQAYIELTQSYCSKKGCLHCAVGASILKRLV